MASYESKTSTKKSQKDNWIAQEAISIVENEKKTWSNAVIYVTEKIAFKIPDLMRICEKNYWGIFDNPIDKLTGREKTWYPLSEEVANAWTDNSDLDQKDIGFRTKPGGNYSITQITRQLVKKELDESDFGQQLDDSALRKAITGTAIWKVLPNGKRPSRRKLVNRLNFFIDPTSESIQAAYRVTERALMFPDEIKRMSGWKSTDDLKSGEGLPANDADMVKAGYDSNTKSRDVYELWGKIPEYLITGDKKDTNEVDGHIVVSGIETGGAVCHLIEKNTKKDPHSGDILKPYEEDWARKIPGRWDGRGPVEQVISLQVWMNTIVNIRINRSYVSQLGLWKIKRGANITPQTIQRLGSNGAILVSSMDDIEQLVMTEASQASFADEANIRDIAKRITRTVETVTGESLPASTTATNGAIQAAAGKNAFTKIKERSGFFAERLINRHIMPSVLESEKSKKDLIRILNNDNDFDEILERIAYHYVESYQNEQEMAGLFLTPEQLDIALSSAKEQLRKKPELFIENVEDLVANLVDCTVYITNEELDMNATVDKLIMASNLVPENERADFADVILDTLGIPIPKRQKVQQNAGIASFPGAQVGGQPIQQNAPANV